ncbi:hypothetical protein J2752_001969 [Halarchaeum rubridurum]|uniref:Uncharacterized protein n=1 Tax=Halarchaeum rubridurum TaxID=489911 RepID=A0A8T4GTA3_9EURY|nr:hypothetical protein [Halarchaeum rubridurum]MBP1955057.1 hypothetical protein [Halarchaeum rubridurum]
MQALVACAAADGGAGTLSGVLPALAVGLVALFGVVAVADHYRGGRS